MGISPVTVAGAAALRANLAVRALSHSLFACRRTGTNAGSPFVLASHLSSRRNVMISDGNDADDRDVGTDPSLDARHAAKMAKKKVARDKIMATKSG